MPVHVTRIDFSSLAESNVAADTSGSVKGTAVGDATHAAAPDTFDACTRNWCETPHDDTTDPGTTHDVPANTVHPVTARHPPPSCTSTRYETGAPPLDRGARHDTVGNPRFNRTATDVTTPGATATGVRSDGDADTVTQSVTPAAFCARISTVCA
jgi:hypothetical protein